MKYVHIRHLMPTFCSLENQEELDHTKVCLDEAGNQTKRENGTEWDDQEREARNEYIRKLKKLLEQEGMKIFKAKENETVSFFSFKFGW